jgi:hypothetical protein
MKAAAILPPWSGYQNAVFGIAFSDFSGIF